MLEAESTLREWGRSVGVIIPKVTLEKGKLKAGDTVKILILKKTNVLKETFGKHKLVRTTEEILREIDEEGWHE